VTLPDARDGRKGSAGTGHHKRRRMVRLLCCLLFAASFAFVGTAARAQVESFYEQQLRAGKSDFQANRIPQAADEFRIAAFGFLDRPPLLCEALVRLAVVQNALGQETALARTLERFIEAEHRFSVYGAVRIEPQIRSKFEEIVVRNVPRATLVTLPAVARLANYEIDKLSSLPAPERISAYRAGAQREPNNPEWPLALAREASARGAQEDVIRWGQRVLQLDPRDRAARALVAQAYVARKDCREALPILSGLESSELQEHPDLYADQAVCFAEAGRWSDAQAALAKMPESLKNRPDVSKAAGLVAARVGSNPSMTPSKPAPPSGKPGDVLDITRRLVRDGKYTDAFGRLKAAAESDPGNRQLRLALLEAAVLTKDWRTAALQVGAVTPLSSGEELYMFYASVALFETGRKEEARPLMERARPRIVSSPMVDYYLQAVLGQRG
jgi:tetratricopeptide (TPR) repeat protein